VIVELLTTDKAAEYIGVTKKTMEWWRFTGAGPDFVKMSRLVRYRKKDIDAWVEARIRKSTSDRGARAQEA
jgi:predicted DNA-binding transcriptional regulator AlpA